MPDTIRKLVGELSFRTDTTGADRFDAATNRSKRNLESLNSISLAGMVAVATKAWAVVATVATAGSVAAAKKFVEVETSLDALEKATGKGFAPLKGEIDSILEDGNLKNLVKEIDLVNDALLQAQEGATGEQISRFLRLAVTLGIVAKRPIGDVLGGLVKGDVEGILKLIGQLPLELQEQLKISGTDFSRIGLAGRQSILEQKLFAGLPALERKINEQRERGLTTFRELDTAFGDLAVELGGRTLPYLKKVNDFLISIIESIPGEIGTPESRTEKARMMTEETFRQIEDIKRGTGDFLGGLLEFATPSTERAYEAARDITPQTPANMPSLRFSGGPNTTTNNRGGDIHITVPITIQAGANANPTEIKTAVNEGISRAMGQISEQNKLTTKIRGGL